ncbi:MAG: hypothetical protein COS85_00235 [Armatimonadetes bacterium CG07_land_8_20_14_0_80_59_28]|nr:MAG: hypothetical protein COS85_00235 [Armatimonadetes bacterium CG07_land_8_20_14_0_80_59_28]
MQLKTILNRSRSSSRFGLCESASTRSLANSEFEQKGHKYLTLVYQIEADSKSPKPLQTPAVDRAGAEGQNPAALFSLVRRRAQPQAEVHLLGYVEALFG